MKLYLKNDSELVIAGKKQKTNVFLKVVSPLLQDCVIGYKHICTILENFGQK